MLVNGGWAALGAGDHAAAATWFVRALAHGVRLAGVLLAEACTGGACALAGLDADRLAGHDPARLLELSDELRRRHALTLTPAQAEARARAGPGPSLDDEAAGPFLAWDDTELAAPVRAALAVVT